MKKIAVVIGFALMLVTACSETSQLADDKTTYKESIPTDIVAQFQSCVTDNDCVYVQNGCCDCANGGKDAVVNKNNLEAFKAKFDCTGVACTMMAKIPECGSGTVSCVEGLCSYTEAPVVADSNSWAIQVKFLGAVVPNPISHETYIDSNGNIFKSSPDIAGSPSLVKPTKMSTEDTSALAELIEKADLLEQKDVTTTGDPCLGSMGMDVTFMTGTDMNWDKTNKFNISGLAECNIKPEALDLVIKKVKTLQYKYLDSLQKKYTSVMPAEEIAQYQSCQLDSDCVYVNNGCCDCANGGKEDSVNKELVETFKARFDCKNIACTEMARIPDCGLGGKPYCVNSQCKFQTYR